MYLSCCTSFLPKLKEHDWKIRSTKVDVGNLKHELFNRLWSTLAVNVLRNLKHIVPQSTLRTIYYAYIHSILSYSIILGGNSTIVNKLFILQKKLVRILSNIEARESCKQAFKTLEIMMLHSQYIFSLIIFTVDNKHLFTPNNEIHKYSTRNSSNLHLPTINLSKFYKGPYISGTKAFNHLPRYLKLLVNDVKYFKISL
jgi:hypothetical protein